MRQITHIIVHCSDSEWGCAREVRSWHLQRGFTDVGYHWIITNGWVEKDKFIAPMNGSIECGRDMDSEGAHCLGYNDISLGVCLILKTKPTIEQLDALKELLHDLCLKFNVPAKNVLGHCETESGKAEGKSCPNFDVEPIRTYLKGRVK